MPCYPRVFLDTYPWDYRSRRNTDWRYVRYLLPRLVEWEPELDLVLQASSRVTLIANLKAIRMAIGRRVGFPVGLREWETDQLDAEELRRSGCNVIFSHRGYPENAGDLPVIWQSSILHPEMTFSYTGLDESALQPELEIRREYFSRAALVQVSTKAEAIRLDRSFPELAGRFVPVPFFLPHLKAVAEEALDRHRNPEKIEILFVGNEAKRKGLDLLLAAFSSLPELIRRQAHLTIVSRFDGAKIDLSSLEGVTVLGGIAQEAVVALMRKAHILVNVARFESYGFIFPEAMSQGVVCVGPDWEVQRELLDEGNAGVNLPCEIGAIRDALVRLVEDEGYRIRLAVAGWTRFKEQLAPEVVARQYAEMFRRGAAC